MRPAAGPPAGSPLPPAPASPGTFRIDREGTWWHEGQEVTHPGVVRNLWANLRLEGDSHYLQVGPARIPVEVADAPLVVTRIEASETAGGMLQNLWGRLCDGTEEALRPETMWLDQRNTPYCRVKGQGFRARLSVAAWLQLVPWLQPGAEPDEVVLVMGTRRVVLPRRAVT